MALENDFKDSAATANAILKRDGDGDGAVRILGTTAVGGINNLGFEKTGVYLASGTITLDNSAVNGGYVPYTTGSSNFTCNLPTAAAYPGQTIEICKVDSGTGTVIIDASGSETINGALTVTIYSLNESYKLRSDGTNWEIIAYSPGTIAPGSLTRAITDPGNAGAIPVTRSGYCAITSTGADTRTLQPPTYVGQQLLLIHAVDGGSCACTVSAAFDTSAHTILTATAVAASCLLTGTLTGVTKKWTLSWTDGWVAS